MTIRIYDKNGGVRAEVSVSDSSSQVKEIGGENVLSLSFVYWSCLELDVQDYVDFAGERYWLTEHYKPEMRSTMEWSYDVKLYGLESLLGRFLVLDRSGESTEAEFVLTGPPVEHVRLIVSCVNAGLGVSPDSPDRWLVGEVTGTENVTLEYKGLRCDAALSMLAEAVGTEWWTDGRTLNVCRCEVGPELTLAYGRGLTGLSRERSDDASFYTRLYPLGSRRNIDAELYGHRRLQLAGGVAYVDMPDLVEKYGVIERYEEAAFAGIYPRRVGRVSSVRSEVRRGRDGQDYTVWFFGDEGLPFDPNDYEIGLVKRVSFQEGSELAGLGTGEDHYFEVNYDSETREFEIITIWPYDDDTQLPGGALVPKVGDRYILWNMRMPPAYYDLAEAELAEAVAAYNDEHRKDCSVYKGSTDEVWMAEHELAVSESETDSRPLLCVGRKVRLESHDYFAEGYRYSRITRLTRSVNRPYSMDLEISDVLVRSFRQHVEEGMRDVKTYARSLFGGVSIPDLIRVGDTRKATDSNVFSALRVMVDGDRKFVRKDWADEHQTVAGNVSFMKGVGVQQKLTVGGDIEVDGTAGLHGDVFIGDALEVGDGAEIGGDLGVVGNTTLGGTTHSAGNVTVGNVATSLLPGTTSGVVLGSDGKILAKSLELSESLVVPEIRYNRATTIVGTEWRTQGGGIIESVTPDTATTGHGTLRLEDGEAGAIMQGDLCIGIWHNIDGGNATADYDSRTGNFTFKGFQTIYFQITGVSGANSQNFTYELREGYTFHPQAGMHFAAYTNIDQENKVGRQSFTYETKDYQVSLRDVTGWTWSENNIYYVRGKLAGFTVGTTTFPADSTETGLILGNIYFSGTIRNIEANIRSVSVTQTKGGWVDTSETDEVTIRLVDGNGENQSDEVDTCTCTSGGVSVPVTPLYDGSTKIGFRVLAQNITAVKTYDVTLTCSDGRVFTAAFAEHPSPTRGENAVMYQLIATPDLLGLDKDENITPGTTIQFRVLKLDGNTKTYLSVTQCRTEGLKLQYGASTWAITTASDLQFAWQKTINQLTFKLLDSSNAELAEKTVKMIKDGETGADATFTTWQLYPSADSVSVDKSGSPSRQGFIVSVRKVTESGMTSYGVNNLPQDVSIRYVVNAISSSKDSQLIYAENNGSGVEKYNSYYDGTTVVNVPTTSTVANKIVGNSDTYGLAVSVPNTLAVPSENTFITFSLWLGNTLYDTKTVPFFKDGQDGTSVTVSSNSTQYAASTSGRTVPSTGWKDSVPDVAKGAFLWTRVTTTYSDGTTATSYGVSYRGTDGTSPTISSTEIRYAASTSGTDAPTSGWQSEVPSVAQKNYLWTRTRVTYSTASGTITTTSYSVARAGADGDTGNPGADGYTTHFAYSTSADGSQNFSTTNFDGATYIGTYRDQNEADSTDYTKYTWTRWRGVDGENVIHVDLDNENDAMLYDGSGNLISGSVTSNASLYDGTTKVSSGVTWSLPTKTNCTATITTAGVVTVTAMSATTGKVVVRATYKSKTYDAILSLKKLVGIDKYELVCTPNSVTYNTTTGNLSATAITIRVYKTAQNGTRANISTLPSNYTLQGSAEFSRAYSGGYATMPVNSSLSSMSVTLKDASGVVLDNEAIPINKSTNGANGNDGKDAQPIRPNIIANGREERYITGTTNSNYPVSPSYSETSSGVTYSVFYGWRHLEIDHKEGARVIVSMNLRWNGLTAVSGATMRVRILMFTGSGNPTIFYKAITTASGEGRFESGSTPTSASGRYLCRVELAGCSAGTIWYSDVKAEIADDNTSTATPWLPCAHDYAGINPNILDYTKEGKDTEGNLMWVQSIANQGVMTIKEDDFALNNPVSYVDAASLPSTQTAIRDEGIVTIPANQPCIVSWDACYVGTEPYRWWLQLLDVNSSSRININYYCLGTSDSSYIIGAGKHLRQQTTNDEGWQRFFVYLDPVSSQRQFKIQFKHDGRNGDGTTSALHLRRVKAELSYFPSPWVISENDKAGLPGKDGVPAVYAGEWDSSAIYYYDNVRREIVLYNGHYYAVKTQGTTCTSVDIPGASSEKWEAFSGEFRSVATDVLLSHDVLASRGRFNGLVVDSLTATNSDFQNVVIRGVLSKMKTTITAAELGSTIAYKKYTALSHQGVLPWSSQANYLNVWRCGDVVDIDCGTTVCKLVLPTAWHATTNGSGTQISPSPTNYADGDFSFASGHGFLLTPNSTVRSYPSIDDIRGLVGRKMVFRNKSNTAEVYICAHRYKRLTSPNEQGDSTVVDYEDGLVVIGKLNIGEMLQVECCVDFVIGNPYSYEGYHWEFFGKGIKYL